MTILIVGLGNPGEKFEKTWHNLGKETLENLAKNSNFSSFKENKKKKFSFSQKEVFGQKIILAKSLTYMNESGEAVKNLLSFLKLKPKNLWLIHDDLDIPLGKLKISKNRSSAGHKGVESIINYLGTKNFVRFRVGIGGKSALAPYRNLVSGTEVLKKSSQKKLNQAIKLATGALIFAVQNNLEKAMQRFN